MRVLGILLMACLGVSMLLTGAALALAQQQAIYANPVAPKMTPKLNLGKLSYDALCASCHGKTGGGTDKGPTFISRIYHPGHHGDGSFYTAAKKGARAHHWPFGDMKPVKGVNDALIGNIIQYVRAVQKANGLF